MFTKCPVCGSSEQFQHPANGELIVCVGCSETLFPTELVKKSTRRTRRTYRKNNPESEI